MSLKHTEANHATAANSEPEPPPAAPSAVGQVTLGDKPSVSISLVGAQEFWPADSTSSVRQVVIVPLSGSDEYVAFGIFPSGNPTGCCCRVPFTAWVKQTELQAFRDTMAAAGAECLDYNYADVPVASMNDRIDQMQTNLQQGMFAAAGWQQDFSNDDTITLSAA